MGSVLEARLRRETRKSRLLIKNARQSLAGYNTQQKTLEQEEQAVEKLSLHIVEAEAGLHIEGTMRLEYKISTMIHGQHK